jgi:hypothetical protein
MYEPKLRLKLLYITAQKKIYLKASILVTLGSDQSIPYPPPGDIIVSDQGAIGKDIEIRLRVLGTHFDKAKYQELVIPVEIMNPGQVLDEQGVRDAIGSKVYNVSTTVYKDNVPQQSTSSEATRDSDVEIE